MIKIGIIGSHGVGKTSLLNGLQANLKDKLPNISINILKEIPRHLVEECNDNSMLVPANNTLSLQFIIMLCQIIEENKLKTNLNSVLLCDRTLIDHWAYTLYLYGKKINQLEKSIIDKLIVEYSKTFALFIYIPIEFLLKNNNICITNKEFQDKIDNILTKYLINFNYIEVAGTIHERINSATDCILKVYDEYSKNINKYQIISK